ncbi:MFS transporter [Nocardioides bruguierae]|uniref:MFS transporter n=1 Tax=Nocardioides bruguierae TaxID=2945102 RepID=UPI00202268A7|nr:MFS transporter [Nocardioides bruguierae]MCL8026902.1 MFS transporter [Nocardioides bruguierae]
MPVLALGTLLSLSVWFSGAAVGSQLRSEWGLSALQVSLLTVAVQLGFATGALALTATGVADGVDARLLLAGGAGLAAVVNLGLLVADGPAFAVLTRFVTGMGLGAVYPTATKQVTTWSRERRGQLLAWMIAAMTTGSALPYLVAGLGAPGWRQVVVGTSALAASGAAVLALGGRPGPFPHPRGARVVGAELRAALSNRPVVLAIAAYSGHMWELYAMWGTLPVFLAGAAGSRGSAQVSLAVFAVVATGALGCLAGGAIGGRLGHLRAARLALVCSAPAALAAGLLHQAPAWALLPVCLWWGFWVIADSAQLSALLVDRADPRLVGAAAATQLAVGFVTTAVALLVVPQVARVAGWGWAYGLLAVGALAGVLALQSLGRPAATPSGGPAGE